MQQEAGSPDSHQQLYASIELLRRCLNEVIDVTATPQEATFSTLLETCKTTKHLLQELKAYVKASDYHLLFSLENAREALTQLQREAFLLHHHIEPRQEENHSYFHVILEYTGDVHLPLPITIQLPQSTTREASLRATLEQQKKVEEIGTSVLHRLLELPFPKNRVERNH